MIISSSSCWDSKFLAIFTIKYFISPNVPSFAKEFFPTYFLNSLLSSTYLLPVSVGKLRISMCLDVVFLGTDCRAYQALKFDRPSAFLCLVFSIKKTQRSAKLMLHCFQFNSLFPFFFFFKFHIVFMKSFCNICKRGF